MFEDGSVSTAGLAALAGALGRLGPAVNDAERIDRIRLLEQLKAAVAAVQAAETAAFAASQHAAARAAAQQPAGVVAGHAGGMTAGRAAAGVAAQVGLARRISPHAAARYVRFATLLTGELPGTYAALRAGQTSEWRAQLIARETGWLTPPQRAAVDRDLAARLPQLGDRRVESAARAAAYRLDPAGAAARMRAAGTDRRVTLRPAPDTMTRLTALLPVPAGVACYAALLRQADSRRAAGDPRGRGQVMADTLVQRLTGRADPAELPVEISLLLTDTTLLTGGPDPGQLDDGHLLPAPLARALALGPDPELTNPGPTNPGPTNPGPTNPGPTTPGRADPDSADSDPTNPGAVNPGPRRQDAGAPRWLRRLYRSPRTGELIAMDATRRRFTPAQRRFIRLRDHTCRTPYCDAPIRHTDHITPAAAGGPTSLTNAQGLCETCNHTKQQPGWHSHTQPDTDTGATHIQITTPTGHRYTSPPPLPEPQPPPAAAPGPPATGATARQPTPGQPATSRQIRLPTRPPPTDRHPAA